MSGRGRGRGRGAKASLSSLMAGKKKSSTRVSRPRVKAPTVATTRQDPYEDVFTAAEREVIGEDNLLEMLAFKREAPELWSEWIASGGGSVWDIPLYDSFRKEDAKRLELMTPKMNLAEGLDPCRKCGCKVVFKATAQTRSADEGQTTILTCTSCANVWRQY